QLTTAGSRFYPAPTPDGVKLAASDLNNWQIYLYDVRDFSKAPELLPPLPEELRRGTLFLFDWSADGRLLRGATDGGNWVYSVDTRTFRGIPRTARTLTQWLPDNRRFVWSRGGGRVSVVDSVSGEEHEVFAIPGETISALRLSPDGSYLYFDHGSTTADIWTARF